MELIIQKELLTIVLKLLGNIFNTFGILIQIIQC